MALPNLPTYNGYVHTAHPVSDGFDWLRAMTPEQRAAYEANNAAFRQTQERQNMGLAPLGALEQQFMGPSTAQVGYDRAAAEAQQGQAYNQSHGLTPQNYPGLFGPVGGGAMPGRAYVPSFGAKKQKEVRPWNPMPAYRK